MHFYKRLLLLLLVASGTFGFYLPGVAPKEFLQGENVTVKVNSIKSARTAVPYDYYSIMVCRPNGTQLTREAENLGELLWGDEIKPSTFQFQMQKDLTCQKVCTTKPILTGPKAAKSVLKLKKRIDDLYRGHLILDNLPVSEAYVAEGDRKSDISFRVGYPLGTPSTAASPTTVNNHLAFTVKIHKPKGLLGWRIVGFEVVPYSIDSTKVDTKCDPTKDFDAENSAPQTVDSATKFISWSYSIRWEEDPDVAWSSRWDHYLRSSDGANIHWFGIVTSLLIVLCLTALVAMIFLRTLHMDFNRYNNPDEFMDMQEETGWKLVHADVFREPPYCSLFAAYVGTGTQLLGMGFVTLLFACLGFLSPARRGALMTAMLVLYALMGFVGGYTTSVLAKMFHEQSWATVFTTGIMFPGQVFVVFIALNFILWTNEAANAMSFSMLVGLIALWFFVSLPLLFMGAKVGYTSETVEPPKKVNDIPRQVPEQPLYMRPALLIVAAGAISFFAVYIELYFILSSLWLNKIYYVFGFFAVVCGILCITCAEVAVVLTYFHLCSEDYRWWWKAYFYGGSCGPFLFLYSIYYLTTSMNMANVASICIYFGYMAVLSYGLFTAMGAMGFLATFVFTRYIYASLKVD